MLVGEADLSSILILKLDLHSDLKTNLSKSVIKLPAKFAEFDTDFTIRDNEFRRTVTGFKTLHPLQLWLIVV
jgi:hypothetical protein